MTVRSSLARFVPDCPADDAEIDRMRSRAWIERGYVVAKPEELGSEWLARGLTAWANERYGQRRVG